MRRARITRQLPVPALLIGVASCCGLNATIDSSPERKSQHSMQCQIGGDFNIPLQDTDIDLYQ